VDNSAELKRRLETAQKKIRTQEEDSDKLHELWAQEKDSWEEDRRKYERKMHVAEGRLKAVLDEFAAHQAAHQSRIEQGDSEHEDAPRDNGVNHGSDTASVRTMSMTNSIRYSVVHSKANGVSLADELHLDEDDWQTENEARESALSFVDHNRTQSRDSMLSRSHLRNQSIDSLRRPGSVSRGRFMASQVIDKLQGGIVEADEEADREIGAEAKAATASPFVISARHVYVDTGVQFSPPSSPQLRPVQADEVPHIKHIDSANGSPRPKAPGSEGEIEANQRRKRVRASTPLSIETLKHNPMISAGSQTQESLLSPPRTPRSQPEATSTDAAGVEMKTEATQTDFLEAGSTGPETTDPPILIPSIAIHPPNTRPSTPHEPRLPQYFKDAACQVSMQTSVNSRSIGMQTEEIRVAERIALLPKHLQPSSITSCPPTPEPLVDDNERGTLGAMAVPPRNPRRMGSDQSLKEPGSVPSHSFSPETHDAYPGNNDDGPLSQGKSSLRRPHRISSLFAGFDGMSSDEADDFADADMSDNDFRTALSAPNGTAILKPARRISIARPSIPEVAQEQIVAPQPRKSALKPSYDLNGSFKLPEVPAVSAPKVQPKPPVRQLDKPLAIVSNNKHNAMRRAALITNGIAAHQGRARSPSFPEPVKEPPFPIPTRASSRKPPFSVSAPSDGTRSPTRDSWGSSRGGSRRGHHRASSIRKVRSAAAIPGNPRYRRRTSRSPPPLSASTEAPESPQLPPMPFDNIALPPMPADRFRTHRTQPSTTTANSANTGTATHSVEANTQGTSVVDAIAQTMVGEWMFKYVRRRKSFGVPEPNGPDGEIGTNGVRHKRWVWLAPYERAVMWSSKQPTSGSALLGKSGRKCKRSYPDCNLKHGTDSELVTIQSVLDVKDDNPAPKGTGPLFNRSILILTPARALKFTATTPERHYVWLTALSFLAHSSQAVPDLMPVAETPEPLPEYEIPHPPARLEKNTIRDSIRITKSRASGYPSIMSRTGATSVASSQQDGSLPPDSARGGNSEPGHYNADINNYFLVPEAADPPVVPRNIDRPYPGSHGRKRSNTGSRIPPPLSFRGFSERGPPPPSSVSGSSDRTRPSLHYANGNGTANGYASEHRQVPSTAGLSVNTNDSSDLYQQSQPSSSVAGGGHYTSGRSSIRTSDASGRPAAVVGNFFDAVGTMRMEAFISPLGNRFDEYPDEADETGHVVGAYKRRSRELGTIGIGERCVGGGGGGGVRNARRRSRHREGLYGGIGKGWSGGSGGVGGGRDDWYGGSRTAGEDDFSYGRLGGHDDPFRGF
jgi:hypothetical protein